MAPKPPPLHERLPPRRTGDPDAILDGFLGWVEDTGLTPYSEQEEAILELLAERHVVLSTPTGSGKSLVALALHFKAICEGRRSFYTAPVKALVNEKFFALCEAFGPERVGMLTGDASINRDAEVVCCTTEVLANMALREGAAARVPYVVLDEFHYYADRERGAAWQIPLLILRDTLFLMMSATLGNTAPIEERLRAFSGRPVAHVHSDVRPVPLDFGYRETPLHETLDDLVGRALAPVYVVSFTQRECSERAQGFTSSSYATREERQRIAEALGPVRFDTEYGRELQRLLRHGIGVHHAGLLPKYRLLVEQLAQRGLLKIVFGTDTLGVGVNVPIRTVLFTALSKFDGERVGILSAREFKQISGRAGRKGFDDRGAVVCQAPEHVIENKKLAARAAKPGARKRTVKKKAPRGFVPWNEEIFRGLVERPPEMLQSRFSVSHGMIVNVLQRERESVGPRGGYGELIELVNRSHDSDASKARQRRRAAALFRSLRSAGVIDVREAQFGPPEVRVQEDLQSDFSLHDALSLWLVEAVVTLDPESESHPLQVLSLVEATLENPRPILYAQRSRRRQQLVARLKAEGVDYEDRRQRAEEVTWDKPDEEFITESFRIFAAHHPWVREEDVRPKSIAREMVEDWRSFHDFVKDYALARSEGLLLRYLSQAHNTLLKTVPVSARTDSLLDVIAFLRALLVRVDSSLVEAWESLREPRAETQDDAATPPPFDLAREQRPLAARVRSELHGLVHALARRDYDEALTCVRPDPEWNAESLAVAIAPFHEEYGEIVFAPATRRAHHTVLKPTGPRTWDVAQVLLDAEGDGLWAVHGEVDLRTERDPEGPLVRILRIGP